MMWLMRICITLLCIGNTFAYSHSNKESPALGFEGGYLAGGGPTNNGGSGGYFDVWYRGNLSYKFDLLIKLNYLGSNLTPGQDNDTSIHETTIPLLLVFRPWQVSRNYGDENQTRWEKIELNIFAGPQIGFYNLLNPNNSNATFKKGTEYSMVMGGSIGNKKGMMLYCCKQLGLTKYFPENYTIRAFNPLYIGLAITLFGSRY